MLSILPLVAPTCAVASLRAALAPAVSGSAVPALFQRRVATTPFAAAAAVAPGYGETAAFGQVTTWRRAAAGMSPVTGVNRVRNPHVSMKRSGARAWSPPI